MSRFEFATEREADEYVHAVAHYHGLRLLINTGDTLGDSRYLRTYRDFQRPTLEKGGAARKAVSLFLSATGLDGQKCSKCASR